MNVGRMVGWAMVALQAVSCVAYGVQGDWRRAAYWFGAVVLTAAVTA